MINLLSGIDSTAAALNAERIRMDVVSENIANVNTTKGLDGKPYQRHQVSFAAMLKQANPDDPASAAQSVQIATISTDKRPPLLVYNPGHPEADARGMVAMPNISVPEEMVDMIASSRAYEANLAVAKNAHSMAMQDLSIGKGQ
ncbi:MAG TPA: flagellar basal body rod protein FlgC [Verrucomicrobiae bacterium]|jgi:flagellar basal-body rod protein FlgC|nr:flagellar basal body rod protein FlgC [Verrucomicrobiae bacterium]